MVVGDPLDPKTEMGAQVVRQAAGDHPRLHRVREDARGRPWPPAASATERARKAKGNFLKPTVFTDVQPRMRIAQEEIFGPVLSVLRFADEAEALRVANGTSYGLAASIWTADVARAHALARKVQAGVVWINCFNEFDDAAPFGGYKESGWGRDLSAHALESYTQLKTVWTQLPEV